MNFKYTAIFFNHLHDLLHYISMSIIDVVTLTLSNSKNMIIKITKVVKSFLHSFIYIMCNLGKAAAHVAARL